MLMECSALAYTCMSCRERLPFWFVYRLYLNFVLNRLLNRETSGLMMMMMMTALTTLTTTTMTITTMTTTTMTTTTMTTTNYNDNN